MKKTFYLFFALILTLSACNSKDKKQSHNVMENNMEHKHQNDGHDHQSTSEESEHNHADHDHGNSATKQDRKITVNASKNTATSDIIDSYLSIKNGLISDDKAATAKAATALLKAFGSFDKSKLDADQLKEYNEIIENATEQAEHIVKSPIDHQREHFEVLTTDVNDLISLLGTNKTLYEDYCPMANDGKGAIWLSEFKDIKNPYFGSKMLKCGKVQKQIN